MPTPVSGRRKRAEGSIEALPSGALRVRVYAGLDPVTKRRLYLTETIPSRGTSRAEQRETEKLAIQAQRRFLTQVAERRNPRTRATLNQLLDRTLAVATIEPSTRRGYGTKIDKHIRPLLGATPVGRIDAETLDAFYAELRRCRDHCDGRPYVVRHGTKADHDCRLKTGSDHQPCVWHQCRGLANSSVRQIHWILSGAFDRAKRWNWLALNPADDAEPPGLPQPDPTPPTAEQAARIVTEAFERDPDWGTFIWAAMTTGARRGELCALRWSGLELAVPTNAIVTISSALAKDEHGQWYEKETKSHQKRRIALDTETVEVLLEHRDRCGARAAEMGESLHDDSYVFSYSPDNSTWLIPDTATQRYERMAARLGVKTTLHSLRHYSATELIAAGVDPRTVGGRLGHSGGGATTLRVYSAWVAEADQRAARSLSARMPQRPKRS